MAFRTLRLEDLEPIHVAGLHSLPLRYELDVRAFGVNANTARAAGDDVIEEHTEQGLGHEELYVVIAGRARFALDGEPLDTPAGSTCRPRSRRGPRCATGAPATAISTRCGGAPTSRCSWHSSRA